MTTFVFFAVMFAAVLHASWNAIIRHGKDKFQGIVLLSVGHFLIAVPMVLVFPFPPPQAWGWLAGSVVAHIVYKGFLTLAYQHGDLSRVYPIARGTAPMLVLIFGLFYLPDVLLNTQVAGIMLVGFGIFLLARGVFTNGEPAQLLPLALASAVGTAGYSIFDGMGARAAGSASSFIGWVFLLDAGTVILFGLARRGRSILPDTQRVWGLGVLSGAVSVAAYWIAVWAMTVAPIALVTALRESSVMFAVLIGVLFFKERADMGKLIAAGVIVGGIILIRI
ncbi:MAG: EamA family transporter [Rhodobacteraceae bacterium]|nr:EamA family transporter [Paracoccaceae bacterium]